MLAAQMQELLNLARIHDLYEAEAWIEDNFPGLATSQPRLLDAHIRQEDTGHGRPR